MNLDDSFFPDADPESDNYPRIHDGERHGMMPLPPPPSRSNTYANSLRVAAAQSASSTKVSKKTIAKFTTKSKKVTSNLENYSSTSSEFDTNPGHGQPSATADSILDEEADFHHVIDEGDGGVVHMAPRPKAKSRRSIVLATMLITLLAFVGAIYTSMTIKESGHHHRSSSSSSSSSRSASTYVEEQEV